MHWHFLWSCDINLKRLIIILMFVSTNILKLRLQQIQQLNCEKITNKDGFDSFAIWPYLSRELKVLRYFFLIDFIISLLRCLHWFTWLLYVDYGKCYVHNSSVIYTNRFVIIYISLIFIITIFIKITRALR
jgi:hypothetical protein